MRISARFDFDLPFEIVEFDRSETRQYAQRELANPNSDIDFAASFAALRANERFDLIWGQHQVELLQIIEWVLRCEPRLWECSDVWDWKLGPNMPNFIFLSCLDEDNFEDLCVNLPFIYEMGRFLVETYIPQIIKPLREKHRCVCDFLDTEYVWIQSFSETPTVHERLEAASQLRQWLRGKVSEAEVARLLPL